MTSPFTAEQLAAAASQVDVRIRVTKLRDRGLDRAFATELWWSADEELVAELEALTDVELAKIGPPT